MYVCVKNSDKEFITQKYLLPRQKYLESLRLLSLNQAALRASSVQDRLIYEKIAKEFENRSLCNHADDIIRCREVPSGNSSSEYYINASIIDGKLQKVSQDLYESYSEHIYRRNAFRIKSCYIFTTVLYQQWSLCGFEGVKKYAKKVDLFEHERIFIPLNINNLHWILAVVDMNVMEVTFIDSLVTCTNKEQLILFYQFIIDYLECEARTPFLYLKSPATKQVRNFDRAMWKCTDSDKFGPVPQQVNAIDCGVFVITAVDYLMYDLPLLYSYEDMNFFRNKILESFLIKIEEIIEIDLDDD